MSSYPELLFEYKYFIVTECAVVRRYDLFSRLKAFCDLIELRILTDDTDFSLYGLVSFRGDDIDPFPSCFLVECSPRYKYCFCRLSELEVKIIGLSGAYVVRLFSGKFEVRLEFAVAYFRIYFAY